MTVERLFLHLFLFIVLSALCQSCASVISPTGGEIDSIAPNLIAQKPAMRQLNYTQPQIILVFDEWIKEKNLKKELLIAPLPKVGYTTKVRKHTFTLTFDSLLEANTTYTFNFRNGIGDLTEGNPTKNNYLIFSTGNFIDSLAVTGTVIDLLTQKPLGKAVVMLFDINDTLQIEGGKPLYMAETDESGQYSMENLRAGVYHIFAIKEKDGNRRYSQSDELIGFLPYPVALGIPDWDKPTTYPQDTIKQKFQIFAQLPDTALQERSRAKQQIDSLLYIQRQMTINGRTPDAIGKLITTLAETDNPESQISLRQTLDSLLYLRRKTNAEQLTKRSQDTINQPNFVPLAFTEEQNPPQIIDFQLASYDFKPLKMLSARPSKQYFEVKFNKESFHSYSFNFLDSSQLMLSDTSLLLSDMLFHKKDKEIVRFYKTFPSEVDSLPAIFTASDSIGNLTTDTITFKFKKVNKPDLQKFDVAVSPPTNERIADKDTFQVVVTFSKPILFYQPDSAFMLVSGDSTVDTVALALNFRYSIYRDSLIFDKLVFQKSVGFLFKKGSFISVENDTASTISLIYKPKKVEEYATLQGKLICPYSQVIVQLLSERFAIEAEQKLSGQKNFSFQYIKPGNKFIRILVDENQNGIWDKGDYKTRRLPEKVYLHPQPIQLKANWDILDLEIKF